ncbi:MarR family transcriptional regulator [Cellulomonas sp. ATA003]|uniref:MarR family winged helix-turn-helix transcriptional regulator n=1 Tax=Cellulomonas sp. ATA003 TaxID=3073064 RepID=UPI002872C79D|nr:MarR family transcriptional regulator [Cellulomonas sp. ATA003]WNB85929.1 MarR family transcriptional regulator [Cellulomonas sp. ATA003]
MSTSSSQTPTPSTASGVEPVRWLDAEQQGHWRAFLVGTARLQDALGRQLDRDSDLSLSEYEVLVRLSESPDRTLRMSLLADELAHSRSRITHTVRRLEAAGLVERQACDSDGRGVNCHMTDAGLARLEAAAPGHVQAVRTHLVDVLTDDQLRAVGEAMTAVREALERG